MLTRADLTRLARREGIGLGQMEHEYVILCLLDTLASTPLGNTLALKGGTVLRQVYFPDWRYSEDLDFSSLPPFDVTELEVAIERWFAHTEEAIPAKTLQNPLYISSKREYLGYKKYTIFFLPSIVYFSYLWYSSTGRRIRPSISAPIGTPEPSCRDSQHQCITTFIRVQ